MESPHDLSGLGAKSSSVGSRAGHCKRALKGYVGAVRPLQTISVQLASIFGVDVGRFEFLQMGGTLESPRTVFVEPVFAFLKLLVWYFLRFAAMHSNLPQRNVTSMCGMNPQAQGSGVSLWWIYLDFVDVVRFFTRHCRSRRNSCKCSRIRL